MTAQVTYTGFAPGTNNALALALLYYVTPAVFVNGTASSTPDACNFSEENPGYFGYSVCYITPSTYSGTENVTFYSKIYNAQIQQYHLAVFADMIDRSSGVSSTISGSANSIDFYVTTTNQASLTINAPLLVAVTIDGSVQPPGPVTVTESPGVHTVSVPQTVPGANGTQLNFGQWSDGSDQATKSIDIEDDTTLTPSYVSQYLLTLIDPSATGAGWYNQGSTVQISAPSSEPVPGILGAFGGTQTFQGWYENGNLVSSSNNATITMNAPQTLNTQWSTNTSTPLIIIIILVVLIGGGLFVFDTHRRRTMGTAATSTSTAQTVTTPPVTPPEEKPRSSGPFCINCGTKLPEDAKFCNLCGTQQP